MDLFIIELLKLSHQHFIKCLSNPLLRGDGSPTKKWADLEYPPC